ncbi:hypothetical protein, partial [Gordonia rubripertincta]|uniref:hypothetical protein n=1 Tax=Gordonia rubripertincta TaxID=36822 RepID=UPI001B3495E5
HQKLLITLHRTITLGHQHIIAGTRRQPPTTGRTGPSQLRNSPMVLLASLQRAQTRGAFRRRDRRLFGEPHVRWVSGQTVCAHPDNGEVTERILRRVNVVDR